MHSRAIAIITLFAFSAIITGCRRCPSACCLPRTPCAPCVFEPIVPCADPPDVYNLSANGETSEWELLPLPAPTDNYNALDKATCQCNAALNTNLANLIELERHWAKVVIECDTHKVASNLCLQRDLLALQANAARNDSAASALESFYQLAAVEARSLYLDQVIGETVESVERLERVKAKGLDMPKEASLGDLEAQKIELEDQRLQLGFLRIQLNGQLQKLLNCPLEENAFYWPMAEWQPDLIPVDVDMEVAEGLSTRSDVRALRLIVCELEQCTLAVARGVLKIADGTLGTVEPTDGWLHRLRCIGCNSSELDVRCKQLAMLLADARQSATAEIKSAAFEVALRQQRVIMARNLVTKRREQLREITSKRDLEDRSVFELSRVQIQLHEAESGLIQQVADLKVAEVKLKQAKGVLAIECGCCPTLCQEGCCDGDCCQCGKKGSCGNQSCACETKRCACGKACCECGT